MRPDSSCPVSIISGSRTGSMMLQTILSKSPELDLTDELQFRSPWWLHRDYVSDIKTHGGSLDRAGALGRLMDLLYSGIPVGWLWSASERLLDRWRSSISPITPKDIDICNRRAFRASGYSADPSAANNEDGIFRSE